MEIANLRNENKSSKLKKELLWNESNQGRHRVEMNLTHGMSRTETYNRPSLSQEPFPFKDTTQSYYYSSKDEFERLERKEKERYERKLIREHLRQKAKDKPLNTV